MSIHIFALTNEDSFQEFVGDKKNIPDDAMATFLKPEQALNIADLIDVAAHAEDVQLIAIVMKRAEK